jgi:hypothetical protein
MEKQVMRTCSDEGYTKENHLFMCSDAILSDAHSF